MDRVGVEFTGNGAGAIGAARQTSAAIDHVTTSAKQSSPSLRGMETDLGRVERGALAGSGALHGMGRAALYLGGTYIGAFGLGAAFKTASEELSKQVVLTAQARAELISTGGVAGVTARAINALAEAESKKTAIDSNQIKAAELMILRFTQVRDVAGQGNDIFTRATKATLDLAAATGQDATSAAATLGKALQDPYKGVTQLTRAHVALTAAEGEHIKQVAKSGDVLGAQKLLLDAVARSYGGTADAVGNAQPWQKLKNTLTVLLADGLRPLLPEFDRVTTKVQAWADKLEHNSAMQKRLKDDVNQALGVAKEFATAANNVSGALGGWKHTIELLIGLKFASSILGWQNGLAGFAGKLAGTEGAVSMSERLLATVSRLAKLGAISIGVSLFFDGVSKKGMQGFLEEMFGAAAVGWAVGGPVGAAATVTLAVVERFIAEKGTPGPNFADNPSSPAAIPSDAEKQFIADWINAYNKAHPKTPINPSSYGGIAGTVQAIPALAAALAKKFGTTGSGTVPSPTDPSAIPGKGVQIPSVISPTHQTAGLPGFPAVDIMAKPGTKITAPENGMITRISGTEPTAPPPDGQGGPWGLSIYYVGTETGNTYFLTHLMKVAPLGSYKRGDTIGLIGDYPGSSSDHVHVGIHQGDSSEAHFGSGLFKPSDFLSAAGKPGATPPTGSGTASTNALPVGIRQALSAAAVAVAAAALTPGKADDKAAIAAQRASIEDEIAWLNAKLATKLGPEKRITYEDLLTGALTSLQGLTPKAKAGASISTITGLRNTVTNDLKGLPPVLDSIEQGAVTRLESLRAKLKVGMSAKDLATTRAGIQSWGKVLKDEITKQTQIAATAASAAATEAARQWDQGWQNAANLVLRDFDQQVSQPQLDAFDKATSSHLKSMQDDLAKQLATFDKATSAQLAAIAAKYARQTPEEKAVADFIAKRSADAEAKQKADLDAQIADTQAQLAALGVTAGPDGVLIDIATGQRTALAANGTNIVQQQKTLTDQLLSLQDQRNSLTLDDQQTALQASADASRTAANDQATADEQAYQDSRDLARQALSDKEADAEAAYQTMQDTAKQALQNRLDDQRNALNDDLTQWNIWLGNKTKSWADFLKYLQDNPVTKGFDGSAITNPDFAAAGAASASLTAAQATGDLATTVAAARAAGYTQSVGYLGRAGILGGSLGFASGGKVPGRYVGRNDTIMARVTPGETVIDRKLTQALEEMVSGGGWGGSGPTIAVFNIDGREFARAVAQPMTAEQNRQISYTIQRG